MNVVGLSEIDTSTTDLVGGKATGLGELIRAGERVPPGFCVTTGAHDSGVVPERELVEAYRELGSGPVAVRSSATAEDLPAASFAGQQDTALDVDGERELVDAVKACWDSLHTDRARAYREANRVDEDSARMAVVVQRMVYPRVAGVLFTANPMTGCRDEMVVDAAPGPGTGVVDGTVAADHYVLDHTGRPGPSSRTETTSDGGCLDRGRLALLHAAGERVQRHFGAPQDIEWAIDADGTLWLLQSRPITTLFPLPPDTGRPGPRVYLEFGHMQGMQRPFTPLGMSAVKQGTATWFAEYGIGTDPYEGPPGIVDVGGRLYGDLTGFVRSKWIRSSLVNSMAVYGPRVTGVVERVLADPRFGPRPGLPFRIGKSLTVTARVLPAGLVGVIRAIARPRAARARAFRGIDRVREQTRPPRTPMTSAERLRFAEQVQKPFMERDMAGIVWPLAAGILVSELPTGLLGDVTTEAELATVRGGLEHNVTTEMDLALWRLAANVPDEHRELLLDTPPSELAARYHRGELPDIGLRAFLDSYGHRAAAEIDIGVPRWAEDPTPVLSTIANYLRITDPEQAPDRRFAEAARRAEAALDDLRRRAKRARPVRGRIAGFLLHRTRELTGLRELGKFAWLYSLAEMRRQLLLVGGDLVDRGLLDRPEDVVFLDLREVHAAVDGRDQRSLVTERRAVHERELRRRRVPVAVLSDGTDPETLLPATSGDGSLTGLGAAPGTATGRARVVHDPADARIEPGEILVAPTTDPGWTPLFMSAAGLVTETGAPIAHGPTVAREYGIPAVICVPDATQRITTGQSITVDGVAGTVTPAD